MKKLAIITTHPIQYYAPLFKLLHERKKMEINVFYTWGEGSTNKHDPGFEKHVEWDLPLLEGYPFEWVNNTSADPGSHHFFGIKNPDLILQINDWNPDAILVFGWAYQSHLSVLRHFKGKIPVYFRGDSTLLDETKGIKQFLKYWFLKWVYKHVDHVFYVGTENKKYFLKYGVKDAQLSFTPHAVDNTRFAEDRSNEALKLRTQLGLVRENILILFAGKFEPKKDPLLLLKAFLKLDNSNTHLLFSGNGPLETFLKSELSSPESQDHQLNSQYSRVKIVNFQNQTRMPVLYQACDLICMPSKGPGETWGLVINEAMACGKAILISDKIGCGIDLVIPNENGLIFKAGDVTDLAEKLEYSVLNKSVLRDYGKRSLELIKSWNFTRIAAGIENKINNESQR